MRLSTKWWFERSVVSPNTGCWNWTGATKGNGYGNVTRSQKQHPAHRLAHQDMNGGDVAGKDVCHRCDNRLCVNPDHLFIGSRKDNMQDAVSKGRQARGDMLPQTKLTESCVIKIRRLLEDGIKQADIAAQFGVTRHNISAIKLGKSWSWL